MRGNGLWILHADHFSIIALKCYKRIVKFTYILYQSIILSTKNDTLGNELGPPHSFILCNFHNLCLEQLVLPEQHFLHSMQNFMFRPMTLIQGSNLHSCFDDLPNIKLFIRMFLSPKQITLWCTDIKLKTRWC